MDNEILEHRLDQVKIKQTRAQIKPIRFKDDAINKVRKENYVFGKKPNKFIPFIVSKDSHQKGLKLRIYKGSPGDKETKSFNRKRLSKTVYKGINYMNLLLKKVHYPFIEP